MRRILGSLLAALSLVALAACSGGNENSTPAPGADGCTSVVVATSSEKVNLMTDLGRRFASSPQAKSLSKCVSVYAIAVPSGTGASILSSNPDSWPLDDHHYWPTVWSPASTIWTDRVAATGNQAYANAASFTHTPVVLGIPETMAKALGYPQKAISLQDIEALIQNPAGWGAVGHPLWGSFKIAKTNPNTSTTGLATILMQSYAAANKTDNLTVDDVTAASDFSRIFESAAIHYGDTTGNVLKTLYDRTNGGDTSSNYVSAIALEETSLYNYNLGNPDSHTVQPGEHLTPPKEKLVAVYPSGGSIFSDDPALTLPSPWVTRAQRQASDAFLSYLQTAPAQEILPKYGFRPLDASVDVSKYLNSSVGIDASQPAVVLPKPAPDVVSAALDQWATIRKPSAVLELIDISGSMTDAIGDGRSKLEGAVDGAQSTLGTFRPSDDVGVWAFTTDITDPTLGADLAEVRPFGPLGGDREKLSSSIGDLLQAQKNGTPLYDALAKAYDYMLKKAEPGRINAIVVLSDGEDTDSQTSLDSLLVKINGSAKEGTTESPVRIFTIAYGDGADKTTLARISQASGGQTFDATDPEKIDAVFASVINNF